MFVRVLVSIARLDSVSRLLGLVPSSGHHHLVHHLDTHRCSVKQLSISRHQYCSASACGYRLAGYLRRKETSGV